MKNDSRFVKLALLSFITAVALNGCASSVPLKPGAEKVQVLNNSVPGPQCQLAGNIIVQTTTYYSPDPTKINKDELNALRNEALKLNANVVTLPQVAQAYFEDTKKNLHVIVGTAYRC